MSPNQRLYMVVSNMYVKEVYLVRDTGDRCIVAYHNPSGYDDGVIRVSPNRLFENRDDAESCLKRGFPMGPVSIEEPATNQQATAQNTASTIRRSQTWRYDASSTDGWYR